MASRRTYQAGQEFTDGMYNFIVLNRHGKLVVFDSEGVIYDKAIHEILKDCARVPGENNIERWRSDPDATPLPDWA